MTGVKQTHARKYKIAIDKLDFNFRVLEIEREKIALKPTDGVYIYGLFLEGANWDKKRRTLAD